MIVTGLPAGLPPPQPHAPAPAAAPDAVEPTGPAAAFPPPPPPQPVWIEPLPLDPIAGGPAVRPKGPADSLAEIDPGEPDRVLGDFIAAALDDAAAAPARYAELRQILRPEGDA